VAHEPIEHRDQDVGVSSDETTRLHGLTLGEAFRLSILDDRDVAALASKAVRRDNRCEAILEGRFPQLTVSHQWPLDISAKGLAWAFVDPGVMIVPGPPLPKPSDLVIELAERIARRLTIFRKGLIDGQLAASGTVPHTGSFGSINRIQWTRADLSIDTRSSDLIENASGHRVVLWSGVVLEVAPRFHVNTSAHDGLPSSTSTPQNPAASLSLTPHRASVEAAIFALWPEGIPPTLPVKLRDRRIMDWQKSNGHPVTSGKTIQRYLSAKFA